MPCLVMHIKENSNSVDLLISLDEPVKKNSQEDRGIEWNIFFGLFLFTGKMVHPNDEVHV